MFRQSVITQVRQHADGASMLLVSTRGIQTAQRVVGERRLEGTVRIPNEAEHVFEVVGGTITVDTEVGPSVRERDAGHIAESDARDASHGLERDVGLGRWEEVRR